MACGLPRIKRRAHPIDGDRDLRTRRSMIEIAAGILRDCNIPLTKTSILHHGGLSGTKHMPLINKLVEKGFIQGDRAHTFGAKYSRTGKGNRWLVEYDRLNKEVFA